MRTTLRSVLANTHVLPRDQQTALVQVMPDHDVCAQLCFSTGIQGASVPSGRSVRRKLQKVARHGVTSVILVGNDPLFRSDLRQLLAYAKKQGLSTALATNALLFDREIMDQCVPFLDAIHIPLDADNESINTLHRSPHQFTQAVATLSDLVDANISVEVSTLVTTVNSDSIVGIAKYLRNVADVWRIFQYTPTMFAASSDLTRFTVSSNIFHRIAEAVEVSMRGSSTSVKLYWEYDDVRQYFQQVTY